MRRCIYQYPYSVGYDGKIACNCVRQHKQIDIHKDCSACPYGVKPEEVQSCKQCRMFSFERKQCLSPFNCCPIFKLGCLCTSVFKRRR